MGKNSLNLILWSCWYHIPLIICHCSRQVFGHPVRLQVHRDVAGDQPQRGRAARRDAGADRAQGGGRREGSAVQGRHSALSPN